LHHHLLAFLIRPCASLPIVALVAGGSCCWCFLQTIKQISRNIAKPLRQISR
jgi:hypothetical protein